MKVYIKFLAENDVYAIDPFWYSPEPLDGFVPPKICGKCGNTLYIPVELPEGSEVSRPLLDIYNPFPKENPYLVVASPTDLPTIEVNKQLSYEELVTLRKLNCMSSVTLDGFSMLIEDIALDPIKHTCENNQKENFDCR